MVEHVTLTTSPDAGCARRSPDEVAAAWSALAARRAPSSVFLTPEWAAVARAHDPREHITLAIGAGTLGIAALERAGDGTLSIAGGELTDEQDLVAAPEHASDAAAALARWIAAERTPRVLFEYVPEDTPTLAVLERILSEHGYRVTRTRLVTSPRVILAGDHESYLQGLGKKERHELRRKLRRFESAQDSSFRWASEAERPRALDRFFGLHRLSKGDKARFMTRENETFFRDVADAAAAKGWLRLGVLAAHGEDAAVLFAFAYGDTLALYNAAYDPALASLSLGIASHAFAIREAIAAGYRVYDLLRGEEPYKYDLGARDRWLWRLDAVR